MRFSAGRGVTRRGNALQYDDLSNVGSTDDEVVVLSVAKSSDIVVCWRSNLLSFENLAIEESFVIDPEHKEVMISCVAKWLPVSHG